MQAIGIDLGGTNLRIALVAIEGSTARVIAEQRCAVANREPQAVAAAIAKTVDQLDGVTKHDPLGIGIAGMLDITGRVMTNSPNLGWRNVPFMQLVEQATARKVVMENDLGAIAWAEHRFGAGRGFANMVCVFIGTGVGGGAVLDGRPYRGGSNTSMEIGHVRVVPGGNLCGCGAHGCLEAYVGGAFLTKLARQNASDTVRALVDGDLDTLHAGHVDDAARAGDEYCRQIIAQGAAFLGGVFGDLSVLFNPDVLVIGGTVWQGCPLLRDMTVRVFSELGPAPARAHVRLVQAELPDNAGVVGAADLARMSAQ